MKNNSSTFYEVNLSDCDGRNATVHVWSDGKIEWINGQKAWRRLLKFYNEPNAPKWVARFLGVVN